MELPKPLIERRKSLQLFFEFGPLTYIKARRYHFKISFDSPRADPIRERESMNLNDYLFSPELLKSTLEKARFYKFLRKDYDAKTVGQGIRMIETGIINPEELESFIHKGALVSDLEFDAAYKGYPDSRVLLKRIRSRELAFLF